MPVVNSVAKMQRSFDIAVVFQQYIKCKYVPVLWLRLITERFQSSASNIKIDYNLSSVRNILVVFGDTIQMSNLINE